MNADPSVGQHSDAVADCDSADRIPWVEPAHQNFGKVTETIASITENPQPSWWWPAFLLSSTLLLGGVMAATYLISTGVGVWGSNIPVAWAFDITNFVFWIGIGHAGTLISAILFLFRQKWRTAINRYSEAMTLFAVMCAGVYPGIHVGRFWYAWFMFPLPNANHIWQNFRSALCWDLFAVGTYFTVSVLFWYMGLIPDLATLRERAKTKYRRMIFAILSFGWRGSTRHWRHYEIAYLLLAGFSTPLVLSVHSVVSFDFATSVIPGWHTTIFPPYFVAGAIFGGFAMVLQCMIPVRTHVSRPEGHRHHPAPRRDGEVHPRHGLAGRLCLCDGVLHRLVFGQSVRDADFHQPGDRRLLVGLLEHDHLQPDHPADPLVQVVAADAVETADRRDLRQYRHVVGAFRHHRAIAASRFSCPATGEITRRRGSIGCKCSATSACSSR